MAHARGKGKIYGYSYVGGGDFLPGVPARDLTVEEYKQHSDLIKENARATGRPLYVPLREEQTDPAEDAEE